MSAATAIAIPPDDLRAIHANLSFDEARSSVRCLNSVRLVIDEYKLNRPPKHFHGHKLPHELGSFPTHLPITGYRACHLKIETDLDWLCGICSCTKQHERKKNNQHSEGCDGSPHFSLPPIWIWSYDSAPTLVFYSTSLLKKN